MPLGGGALDDGVRVVVHRGGLSDDVKVEDMIMPDVMMVWL